MEDVILYEHPMNETIRVCLRLECIFAQAEQQLQQTDYWSNRATVAAIVNLINILDRPEFKTKLTQQYVQLHDSMQQLTEEAQVDHEKLAEVISQLTQTIDYLQSCRGKLTHQIEQDEFISMVRLRLAKTGGAQNFDLPMYHFWLQQDESLRQQDLQRWLASFNEVRHAVELLIKLIRHSTRFSPVDAPEAFHEQCLDSQVEYQLIRLAIPASVNAYPEMSVGRHRVNIHFYQLNQDDRPVQYKQPIQFKMACCT